MRLNREWHVANPMPKNATREQRIAWHTEHLRNCQCRPPPESLREEVQRRSGA